MWLKEALPFFFFNMWTYEEGSPTWHPLQSSTTPSPPQLAWPRCQPLPRSPLHAHLCRPVAALQTRYQASMKLPCLVPLLPRLSAMSRHLWWLCNPLPLRCPFSKVISFFFFWSWHSFYFILFFHFFSFYSIEFCWILVLSSKNKSVLNFELLAIKLNLFLSMQQLMILIYGLTIFKGRKDCKDLLYSSCYPSEFIFLF